MLVPPCSPLVRPRPLDGGDSAEGSLGGDNAVADSSSQASMDTAASLTPLCKRIEG